MSIYLRKSCMYKNLTIVALIALFFSGQVSADSHVDPDFNDDGIVGPADYDLFVSQWGTQADGANWDAKFDLNSDGVIGAEDYDIFVPNWGKTFPVAQNARDVLVALYNATGGTNWTNSTNWLTDNDISTWHGVSTSNGLVTRLNLSFNQLRGEIPAALGNLSNLKQLWLVNNQLSGALPQSLTRLTNLMHFSFGDTDLCAPLDTAFQAWLQGVEDTDGPNCSR